MDEVGMKAKKNSHVQSITLGRAKQSAVHTTYPCTAAPVLF